MFGLPMFAAVSLIAAATAGLASAMTARGLRSVGRPLRHWPLLASILAGVLSLLLCAALQIWGVQSIAEVRPTPFWQDGRALYQCILLALLVAATCTDLDDYYIPDVITVPGILMGIGLAVISGDLQVSHVWVDWNQAIPQIRGPYLPAWLSTHPHLHGLAWSLAGLGAGMGLTWAVRGVASRVTGQEALGFGDVMLMGMVGSYLGWQPVVVAFLIAPFCAILVGLSVRLLGGRPFIPYGPYLALATLIVMLNWRWIWTLELRLSASAGPDDRQAVFAVNRLFGDWVSLLVLVGIVLVGLILLLGLSRLYRWIPVTRRQVAADESSAADEQAPQRPESAEST
jgi:leader peptidase (prepilin peptidase) / N-methyltransferase